MKLFERKNSSKLKVADLLTDQGTLFEEHSNNSFDEGEYDFSDGEMSGSFHLEDDPSLYVDDAAAQKSRRQKSRRQERAKIKERSQQNRRWSEDGALEAMFQQDASVPPSPHRSMSVGTGLELSPMRKPSRSSAPLRNKSVGLLKMNLKLARAVVDTTQTVVGAAATAVAEVATRARNRDDAEGGKGSRYNKKSSKMKNGSSTHHEEEVGGEQRRRRQRNLVEGKRSKKTESRDEGSDDGLEKSRRRRGSVEKPSHKNRNSVEGKRSPKKSGSTGGLSGLAKAKSSTRKMDDEVVPRFNRDTPAGMGGPSLDNVPQMSERKMRRRSSIGDVVAQKQKEDANAPRMTDQRMGRRSSIGSVVPQKYREEANDILKPSEEANPMSHRRMGRRSSIGSVVAQKHQEEANDILKRSEEANQRYCQTDKEESVIERRIRRRSSLGMR